MAIVRKNVHFSKSKELFLKSMLITFAVILLIIIGYFSAGFFFGEF